MKNHHWEIIYNMLTNFSSQKQKFFKERAQAIVEFAVVLPVLLLMLVGILEVSRMAFYYAAVNNASREAVRYASAFGLSDTGSVAKYNDCAGIRNMATRSAFFTNLTITLYHDEGVTNANPPVPINQVVYCTGTVDSISVSSGDRMTVEVSATYSPMVNLIPISSRQVISRSSRTILGILELTYP